MTKLKIGIITAIVAAGVAVPWILNHQSQVKLRQENEALRLKAEKNDQLAAENERLAKLAARASVNQSPTNEQFRELMKLRGEVGKLRQQAPAEPGPAPSKTNQESTLSSFTANPQMRKAIRDQQKAGLAMIYNDFAKKVKLPPEKAEKLNELLADNVMENIDHITAVLREKKSPEEMAKVFADQEAVSMEKVRALLEPEAAAQYEDYNRNLLSHLTAEQFKGMLKGDKAAKEEQSKQLYALMQEETKTALEGAGLDPNFQTVPNLNFINIASEQEADKNLKLMDDIYNRVAARATSFLNPEDLKKFAEFQAAAINGNRMALGLNRKMMAPGSP